MTSTQDTPKFAPFDPAWMQAPQWLAWCKSEAEAREYYRSAIENERAKRKSFPVGGECPEKRGGATRKVRGSDLQVGDILFFLSNPHRLTHFEPYTGPFDFIERIAKSGNAADPHCWGMSIEPNALYYIA